MTVQPKLAETLLTPAQLQERWGLRAWSLAEMRRQGKGPPFIRMSDRRIRYRLSDVEKFEADRLRSSVAEVIAAAPD
jgi:hypothetical protein